ncbi:MAG: O-methyltransferase [Nitrospirales bacterium]
MKQLVPLEIEAYAEACSVPETEVCRALREETWRIMDVPHMVVGPLEGAFLKLMTRLVRAHRVLELGTFTGYSALCFAEVLPDDGHVVTCEIDPESAAVARRFFCAKPGRSKNRPSHGASAGHARDPFGPLRSGLHRRG